MKDIKINKSTINIKIEATQTPYLREFTFKNINYRRKVRNDFVAKLNEYHSLNKSYKGFLMYDFLKEYHDEEVVNRVYQDHCIGISEQVMNDMIAAIKSINTLEKHAKEKGTFEEPLMFDFKKRDNYRGSFKVHCKAYTTPIGNLSSRISILDKSNIKFRVRGKYGGFEAEFLTLNLNGTLYDDYDDNTKTYIRYYTECGKRHEYRFRDIDIKTISFIHDLGKIYIQLSISCIFLIDNNEVESRQNKCGIDTGIHNPFMLYDGSKTYSLRMSDKRSNKIHYLERKERRLQSIMSKKLYINKKNGLENPYSKNYKKIQKKRRKILRRISNIKRDWIFNICKMIVTRYQCIVVDTFQQPTKKEQEKLPNKIKRKINYTNRFHRMYFTNQTLIHMAKKYGCEYVESPPFTTCRCSECGKINKHLPLGKRMFTCKKCGYTDDRDVNASKNCYNYI